MSVVLFRSVLGGALLAAALAGTPVFAADKDGKDPDVVALAHKLADKPATPATPAGCAEADKLPDGTCPDVVATRQLVMNRGGATPASYSPARAVHPSPVHQDISMTFERGQATLTPHARKILDRLAVALNGVGTYRPFTVEGHTDRSGSRDTNLALSQARAQAVVTYLASKGVDVSRIKAQGYGFDRPLPGLSPDRPENRRVEVTAL